MIFNNGEYGQKVYVNLGTDISSATDLTIVLQPQVGEEKTRTAADGVAVGGSNITVDDADLIANEYLEYTLKSGDLDYSGLWRIKGRANTSSTVRVISDYNTFEVRP